MKLKGLVLTLVIGISFGVIGAPLIIQNLRSVFLSPTPLSWAETQELQAEENENKVLGSEETENTKAPETKTSLFGSLISPSASPKPKSKLPRRSDYAGEITVAAFGDHMIDALETDLPYLKVQLQNFYPQAEIKLFNYGMGSQTINQGQLRLSQEYTYKERQYPALTELDPDLIILGSFSYSPFSDPEDELYKHWAYLAKIVEEIKEKTEAEVIILATIGPHKEKFGLGAKEINWSEDFAWKQGVKIEAYLKNTINFAQVNKIPLVDVYTKTLLSDGEPDLNYIDQENHIYPNQAGKKLIAQLLAEKIYRLQFIEE